MIKRFLPIALISALAIGATSCSSNNGFKKYKGLEYKIIKDNPGKKAAMGDVVEFNIIAKVDTLTLGDSRKSMNGQPAVERVQETRGSGQFEAIFPLLAAGDSAVITVSCDTLLKSIPPSQKQLPPWLKKGNKITINLSIVSIKSMEQYQKEADAKKEAMMKEMTEKSAAQAPIDDKILQDYFAKNNLKPTKTASGLYYSIVKPGSGAQIAKGQSVTMNYTGKTLDGKEFDSNTDPAKGHVQPFTFNVGVGQVIKGWDEGVQLLKKGSKAIFYIPSPLAYGPQAQGADIPANSILTFDVEVVDVKNAAPQPQGQPQPQQMQ
jgi:FKBP-type peptidyl-prolyl cis-trans isomerase